MKGGEVRTKGSRTSTGGRKAEGGKCSFKGGEWEILTIILQHGIKFYKTAENFAKLHSISHHYTIPAHTIFNS